VAEESEDPQSTLEFYRSALRIRRELDALGEGSLQWEDSPSCVLAIRRLSDTGNVLAVLNTTDSPVRLPSSWGSDVLLASGPEVALLDDDGVEMLVVGGETAVWVRG